MDEGKASFDDAGMGAIRTAVRQTGFLRAMGVASAGLAGAALIGCGDNDDDEEPGSVATGTLEERRRR